MKINFFKLIQKHDKKNINLKKIAIGSFNITIIFIYLFLFFDSSITDKDYTGESFIILNNKYTKVAFYFFYSAY